MIGAIYILGSVICLICASFVFYILLHLAIFGGEIDIYKDGKEEDIIINIKLNNIYKQLKQFRK